MTMTNCRRARRELLRGVDRVSGTTARHLAGCSSCTAFAERFAVAAESLREHRAGVAPDAGFAARVTAALPAAAMGDDFIGRAALRLLPATLALALVLGGWCWLRTTPPDSLAAAMPSDDVLVWVLENGS